MEILSIMVVIALVAVLGVLMAGIILMGRKGPKAARLSNKLMRARVALQFIAIALIVTLAILANG